MNRRILAWTCWGVIVGSLLVAAASTHFALARFEQRLIEVGVDTPVRRQRQVPTWLVASSAACAVVCLGVCVSRRGRARIGLRPSLAEPSRLGHVYLAAFAVYVAIRAVWGAGLTYFHRPWLEFPVRWCQVAIVPVFAFVGSRSVRGPLTEWGWSRGRGALRELAIGAFVAFSYRPLVGFAARAEAGILVSPRFWSAVVVAPLVEETVYRGMLYRHLRDRWAWPVATLVSAALFAMAHSPPVARWPYLFVAGVVFALLREWRGSLLAPISAHAAGNLLVVLY